MRGLTFRTQVYVLAVGLTGPLLLALLLVTDRTPIGREFLFGVLALGILSLVTERFVIPLPKGGGLTASTIPQIAGVFLLPLPWALAATAAAAVLNDISTRTVWFKVMFNTSVLVLSLAVAGATLAWLDPAEGIFAGGRGWYPVMVVSAALLAYYLTNTALTNTVIAMERRTSPLSVWLANNSTTFLLDIGQTVLGVLAAFLWTVEPVWVVLGLVPALMTCRAFRYIRELEDAGHESILSLAESIDQRDAYTYHHSERVSRYAEMIANRMGLNPHHVELITTAARVHDLGKMGVSNDVLFKPEALSPDECTHMARHPEVGANILRRFGLFKDGVECVRHHHERYDGTGYPDGLRGEAIPLSARILAVADSYEAMTSDRPYRRALSQEQAVEELKAGMGTQFDPVVVGTFLKILEGEHPRLRVLPTSVAAASPPEEPGARRSSASSG